MPSMFLALLIDLLAALAQAVPTKHSVATKPTSQALHAFGAGKAFHPVGFDASLQNSSIFNQYIVPKLVPVTDDDLAPFRNVTVATSYHGTLVAKRSDMQHDVRYQYTNSNAFPWRAVGILVWSNGYHCSAALIGRRHVLTAAHCVYPGGSVGIFCPSYDTGPNQQYGCANIVTGVGHFRHAIGGICETADDWHILIIDRDYGDKLGFFGAETPWSGGFDKAAFTTLGYPGDRDGSQRPYRADGLTIPTKPLCYPQQFLCRSDGPFFTNLEVARGQSGSPFWQGDAKIWGVMSVKYPCNDQSGSGLASGANMIAAINYMRHEFP